jgi:hypothetical protein
VSRPHELFVRRLRRVGQSPSPSWAIANTGPRRKRLNSATRRETILYAAVSLFASLSCEQTLMADVAARVGMTETRDFQNFGTKTDPFAAPGKRLGRASDLSEGTLDTIRPQPRRRRRYRRRGQARPAWIADRNQITPPAQRAEARKLVMLRRRRPGWRVPSTTEILARCHCAPSSCSVRSRLQPIWALACRTLTPYAPRFLAQPLPDISVWTALS